MWCRVRCGARVRSAPIRRSRATTAPAARTRPRTSPAARRKASEFVDPGYERVHHLAADIPILAPAFRRHVEGMIGAFEELESRARAQLRAERLEERKLGQ